MGGTRRRETTGRTGPPPQDPRRDATSVMGVLLAKTRRHPRSLPSGGPNAELRSVTLRCDSSSQGRIVAIHTGCVSGDQELLMSWGEATSPAHRRTEGFSLRFVLSPLSCVRCEIALYCEPREKQRARHLGDPQQVACTRRNSSQKFRPILLNIWTAQCVTNAVKNKTHWILHSWLRWLQRAMKALAATAR